MTTIKDELIKKRHKARTKVVETLQQIQRLNRLNKREFARTFYGLTDSNWNELYIRDKFNKYCEEGFLSAYNRLDVKNSNRVIDIITEEVW
tara:strand:+ start:1614 stop:1886 length:273 start_codon:yes stop_codon:yes gene_type:complete